MILIELKIKPPNGIIHKFVFSPRARVAQNHNIVEDLAQAPSFMSNLEVLQNCPAQKKALLARIGVLYPLSSNLVVFNHETHMPRLLAQLAFMIQVLVQSKTIHQTIMDEQASTYIMSLPC